MAGERLPFVLFFFGLLLPPQVGVCQEKPPQAPKKAEKPAGPAKDPKLEALAKGMKALASKEIPVHFKIRLSAELPFQDKPLEAEGELWAVGDKKLHFVMVLKPGRLEPVRQEILMNDQGAWNWSPMMGGQVVFFSRDLIERIRAAQKKGFDSGVMASAQSQIDVISGLEAKGFHLKYVGREKWNGQEVDRVEGTRTPPGKQGATMEDPEGKIDRVVLLVGAKDRVPRKIEWFAGKERVRVLEYSDVTVGKKIDEKVFQLHLQPGQEVVNALDHPLIGQTLKEMLNRAEKAEKK